MMLFTFSWTLMSSHACQQSYKPQTLSTKFSKFAAPLAYSPCMPNLPKPLARVHGVVNGSDARSDERLCYTHRLIKKGCKKTSTPQVTRYFLDGFIYVQRLLQDLSWSWTVYYYGFSTTVFELIQDHWLLLNSRFGVHAVFYEFTANVRNHGSLTNQKARTNFLSLWWYASVRLDQREQIITLRSWPVACVTHAVVLHYPSAWF